MSENTSHTDFEKLNRELRKEKFFVVDKKVFDLYQSRLFLPKDSLVYLVENPEEQKSILGYEKLISFLLENKITRKDRIVAIGGGAVGDLAGFAAATVLRGVEWICVPTTLLSMVDSSIGGKTGINTSQGKNLVGAFHMPVATPVVPEFLKTLPEEELCSGRGEVLKYAFLDERVYKTILEKKPEEEVIGLCRAVKTEIVRRDFKEGGERAKLNLGHTFGHVIEKMTGVPHGVAVAMGLEIVLQLFAPELLPELENLKSQFGLSYHLPSGLDEGRFWDLLTNDKKVTKGAIVMVIPHKAGASELREVSIQELKKALERNDIHPNLFK